MKYVLIAILIFLACAKVLEPKLISRISISAKGDFKNIDKADCKITSNGIDINDSLFISETLVSGTIDSVPAGKNRRIKIDLYENSVIRFSADTVIDIENGDNLNLDVMMLPVYGPQSGYTCRESGLNIVKYPDSIYDIYYISWKPFEDSLKFMNEIFSYNLIMDNSSISNNLDGYLHTSKHRVTKTDVFDTTYIDTFLVPQSILNYRLFISSSSREIIYDCGDHFVY